MIYYYEVGYASPNSVIIHCPVLTLGGIWTGTWTIRHWDEFNDLPYWVLGETQEATYDEPSLETYIPKGWVERPPESMWDEDTQGSC